MTDHRVTFVDPVKVEDSAGNPPEFDLVERKCLAQGDSWFSIGSIPPGLTSNILAQLELTRSTAVVNCAHPGRELSRMTDTTSEPRFMRLLRGRLAVKWDAILISGGGNDLIEAAGAGPGAAAGLRLLATPDERGPAPADGDAYISNAGWTTFEQHLGAVFNDLVKARDGSAANRQVPMVLHTYCHVMPRPAPAGPKVGPWLQPAMLAFAVPPDQWLAVSVALMDRLAGLLSNLIAAQLAADPNANLHLVDSRAAGLVPGDRDATGRSNDFVNEIHPTRDGYNKLAAAWRPVVDVLLG